MSQSPHWFHAVNVFWAAAASAVLAGLAALLAGPVVGLLTGLLFAVHPVHVEATANVVGRAELIAATGYGLALLFALRAQRRAHYLVAVALAAALAIGSKEHAATLPAAVVLMYLARGKSFRSALPSVISATVPLCIYFLLRPAVTGSALSAGGIAPGLGGLGLFERTWAVLALSVEWWRLLLVPIHLSADYSPMELAVTTGWSAQHLMALILWSAFLWLAWRLRRTVPSLVIGLGWVVVTILPTSNALIPTEVLVAERTLYLPSWGVAFAAAGVVTALSVNHRLRIAVVTALLIAGAARSVARIGVWRDDDALLAALGRDAPRSYRTLWLQGLDAFNKNRWGTGERLLRKAIAAAPQLPGPREELARHYAVAGYWTPAAQLLRESLEVDSTRYRPWELLPMALASAGDTAEAARLAEAAVARFPQHFQVNQNALAVFITAGRCDTARPLARRLFSRVPPGVPIDSTALVARCPAPG